MTGCFDHIIHFSGPSEVVIVVILVNDILFLHQISKHTVIWIELGIACVLLEQLLDSLTVHYVIRRLVMSGLREARHSGLFGYSQRQALGFFYTHKILGEQDLSGMFILSS